MNFYCFFLCTALKLKFFFKITFHPNFLYLHKYHCYFSFSLFFRLINLISFMFSFPRTLSPIISQEMWQTISARSLRNDNDRWKTRLIGGGQERFIEKKQERAKEHFRSRRNLPWMRQILEFMEN